MGTHFSSDPVATHVYDPARVEREWQARWIQMDAHQTRARTKGTDDAYVFVTPPFTSGDAHLGHVRSYTLGDAYARFRRAQGAAVLFSLGFDTFGLPTELRAAENGMSPRDWVDHCCRRMRGQFESLGLSFDWSRMAVASEPDVYRWTQWLFLVLLQAGLVYRRGGQVAWCDGCETSLASAQAEKGRCWRCDRAVRLVYRTQWYLRTSAYNEENEQRLRELSRWNKAAIGAQRAILGRTEGFEFDLRGIDGSKLTVFTPYREELSQATFVALSPNHPELARWVSDADGEKRLSELRVGGLRRSDRSAQRAQTLDTGARVWTADMRHSLPVLVSSLVDGRYGALAAVGIPEVDQLDRLVAEQCGTALERPWGVAPEALQFRPAASYRAGDFSISRERAWGAPMPIVNCEFCGAVPVPLDQLPVLLPEQLGPHPGRSRLADHAGFVQCSCPACGSSARRETDTIDCHMDATWCYVVLAVPAAERGTEMFSHPEARRWLPVEQLIHGADIGGFILNMRMGAKALREIGVQDFPGDGEPFEGALMHGMVNLGGRKMSKHLGNVVSLEELVGRVGADAVRFAILFAAAPAKNIDWADDAERTVHHSARFLKELWRYGEPRLRAWRCELDAGIDGSEQPRAELQAACTKSLRRTTRSFERLDIHRACRNVIDLLASIQRFEEGQASGGDLDVRDRQAIAHALSLLVRMLFPLAPHIAEELWRSAGHAEPLAGQAFWPSPTGSPLASAPALHDAEAI
jgi:leucyl-tRNA synthetase